MSIDYFRNIAFVPIILTSCGFRFIDSYSAKEFTMGGRK